MKPNAVLSALESAYLNLENNRELLNSLNVFPVPDGDTGSNMCMTFLSGLEKVRGNEYTLSKNLLSDFSLACLMGARGNSGVILSLAIKGFSLASEKSGTEYLACAFKNATKLCYDSVMSAKEGTALTVLRLCSEKAEELFINSVDFRSALREISKTASNTVEKTTEMLPELRKAGVVDAGAKGIFSVLDGIRSYFDGETVPSSAKIKPSEKKETYTEIKNKFCCEFVVRANAAFDEIELKNLGDSVINVNSDGFSKIHIHSNYPEKILSLALKHGEIINAKIENMAFQHSSKIESEKKKFAFVSVSTGVGFTDFFTRLRCDEVIFTRKKVSSGEVLSAIEKLNADTVFLLPNDKNNFLAFSQAVKMSDKDCVLINTIDPVQALEVLLSFDENADKDENSENMLNALACSKTAKICRADKDSGKIKKGDFVCVEGEKVLFGEKDILSCVKKTVEKLCVGDYNSISIFAGEGCQNEAREKIKTALEEMYPNTLVTSLFGGQDIYDVIIGVN